MRSGLVACVCAVVAGCAGVGAGRRSGVDPGELDELRNQVRRDRRLIRNLENQITLLRSNADAPLAAEATGELPAAVAPKAEPPADPQPSPAGEEPAADEGYEIAGLSEDGSEIVYVGDAAKPESGRPTLRIVGSPPPVAGAGSPTAADLAPPPVVGGNLGRIPVIAGDVPTVENQMRQARALPPLVRNRTGSSPVDPRIEYQRSIDALRAGNHAYAMAGFRNFIARFARHEFADNAQYWLGEAYYDQKQYKSALAEFRRVVDVFPDGNKVPDALLKIAYCHLKLGSSAEASVALDRLVAAHPRSAPAVLARDKLAELSTGSAGTARSGP